ncbi:MAG: outer membrane beta-barrel protein, partial [Bacteroidota bacterium]
GLNMNNYKFDGNNNILKGTNGIIEELNPGTSLKKSKLATVYLNLPFMLEIQIPVDNNHLNIAAGPIGAVKIGSHTKMVYQDGQKVKINGDFSLNMLRYGTTARIGYENFQLYGTYYITPLFRTGKGPEGNDLYPFEIGVAFTFND